MKKQDQSDQHGSGFRVRYHCDRRLAIAFFPKNWADLEGRYARSLGPVNPDRGESGPQHQI